ncbi:MAG TPA: hypothetical protein VFN67_06705 [Polyangiales bacterium]|nr:hypothetical protein [Polyangiales bacterium]
MSSYNPRVTPLAAACTNHPTREAIGICISCRCRLCSECTTKLAGINHCVTCLALVSRAEPARAVRRGVGSIVSAAMQLICLSGLIWGLLAAAFPSDPGATHARHSFWNAD